MPHPSPAIRALRAHREGVLVCDGVVSPLCFVIDNPTGRVVFPCSEHPFEAEERVLFIPEESDAALQLLLTPEPIDPDTHEGADRWKAYHGTPESSRWASCGIESGRLEGEVLEGEALMLPNPIRGAEPALCKRLNADPARLRRLARGAIGIDIPSPLCVGVDPEGLDLRARFGIVRVPFRAHSADGAAASAAIDRLLAESGA